MDSPSPLAIWCGRLDLHLLDRQKRTVGMLQFSLRLDLCTVSYQTRTLAVIDRDQLRAWLFTPASPLVVDDLVWSIEGSRVALGIDQYLSYLVPDVFIRQLISVI